MDYISIADDPYIDYTGDRKCLLVVNLNREVLKAPFMCRQCALCSHHLIDVNYTVSKIFKFLETLISYYCLTVDTNFLLRCRDFCFSYLLLLDLGLSVNLS